MIIKMLKWTNVDIDKPYEKTISKIANHVNVLKIINNVALIEYSNKTKDMIRIEELKIDPAYTYISTKLNLGVDFNIPVALMKCLISCSPQQLNNEKEFRKRYIDNYKQFNESQKWFEISLFNEGEI